MIPNVEIPPADSFPPDYGDLPGKRGRLGPLQRRCFDALRGRLLSASSVAAQVKTGQANAFTALQGWIKRRLVSAVGRRPTLFVLRPVVLVDGVPKAPGPAVPTVPFALVTPIRRNEQPVRAARDVPPAPSWMKKPTKPPTRENTREK